MKIALVHDWLTKMRGGERVMELLCELYPSADIFTLVKEEKNLSPTFRGRRIETSWLQRWPGASRYYRYYLPLLPLAAESFELSEYDLVISSSSAVVKGVMTRPDALHISYVHTPMRYIWDLAPRYFPRKKWVNRILAPPLLAALRTWDVSSAQRVDRFVANSNFVAERIRKYYRRSSTVIHPPIDTARFAGPVEQGERYLMVSALVENKSVELAVEAFNELGRPLRIVGSGPLERRLRKKAASHIEFTGWISDEELRAEYLSCRAFVHTALEDFGIAPLEAAAAGKATIALGRGGVLDSVVPWPEVGLVEPGKAPTGVFFHEERAQALGDAVRRFEKLEDRFDPGALRAHAELFDRKVAKRKLASFVDRALRVHRGEGLPASIAEPEQQSAEGVERAH